MVVLVRKREQTTEGDGLIHWTFGVMEFNGVYMLPCSSWCQNFLVYFFQKIFVSSTATMGRLAVAYCTLITVSSTLKDLIFSSAM